MLFKMRRWLRRHSTFVWVSPRYVTADDCWGLTCGGIRWRWHWSTACLCPPKQTGCSVTRPSSCRLLTRAIVPTDPQPRGPQRLPSSRLIVWLRCMRGRCLSLETALSLHTWCMCRFTSLSKLRFVETLTSRGALTHNLCHVVWWFNTDRRESKVHPLGHLAPFFGGRSGCHGDIVKRFVLLFGFHSGLLRAMSSPDVCVSLNLRFF